jgi:Core-2/I-Branching enzyme
VLAFAIGMHYPGPSFGVRLAYVISAYKNLGQVSRLIRRLHGGGAIFLVHVDKKTSNTEYRALADDVGELRGVELLERHSCHWGGFGHVRATLKGIARLASQGSDFDHLILLTGQDYPIKSNAFIERFFADRRGTSFMHFDSLPTEWWSPRGGLDRIEYPHLRFNGHHARIPVRRSFPRGLEPYGGGAYWSLSRDAVQYVSGFVKDRPDVVAFFKHVDIPDEIFFQTVLLNSPLAKTIVNDHLRYIDWTRGPRPAILETSDFEALAASPKLFARKFDVRHDEQILDLIDERLLDWDDAMPPPVLRGLST